MSYITQTIELGAIDVEIPATFGECIRGGASSLGLSTTSSWLSCPQYSFLTSQGVQRRGGEDHTGTKIPATAFGSLFHALRAIRYVHGHARAEDTLRSYWESHDLPAEDAQKALLMLRMYDQQYPINDEPFDILGVECTIYTNIRDWWGRPLYKSVRYDTVVKMKTDGAVFSLECKTGSRSGQAALNPYILQGMTHSGIWNANAQLVEKYGEMQGTIWDHCVKTAVPHLERIGPRYFTKQQQADSLDYLRLPEAIKMPKLPSGSYPKFFHTCWGRWAPCQYIGLCHEQTYGDYEQRTDEGAIPYRPAEAA